MLDLNEVASVPTYQIKVGDLTKEWDPLVLGFQLRMLEGIEDPEKIRDVIVEVVDIPDLDCYTASVILNDFLEFAERELDEPLKKVFGRGLFSTTTTDSAPKSTEH